MAIPPPQVQGQQGGLYMFQAFLWLNRLMFNRSSVLVFKWLRHRKLPMVIRRSTRTE